MLNRSMASESTYAWKLVLSLHSDIFVKSLDIKKDYDTYFTPEYPQFAHYLRREVGLSPAAIGKLSQAYASALGMYLFDPYQAFLLDENGANILSKLIDNYTPHGTHL